MIPFGSLRFTPRDDLAFHREMTQVVNQWVTAHGEHRFANAFFFLKLGILVLLCLGFYILSFSLTSTALFLTAYFGFMFSGTFLAVNVMHDASHNAIFRHYRANQILGMMVSVPIGLDFDCWRVRHVICHHEHVNIEHYDLDIDANGVLRQTPFQTRRGFMRWQHLYWPVAAALTFPAMNWWFDWRDRTGKTKVTAKLYWQGAKGWFFFTLGKSMHLLMALILPCLFSHVTLSTVLLAYIGSQMLSSLFFIILIISSHWAKGRFWQAPESGVMPHGRYQHLFITSLDWTTKPVWIGYWLGQINLHLTHHLFPNWNHRHYPQLARMLAEVAQKHGYDYQSITVCDVFKAQQRFLKSMGSPDGNVE